MPELPEVETSLRGIRPHIENRVLKSLVVRQPSLRWQVPPGLAALIEGKRLKSLSRRSKYLLLDFGAGVVIIHLGMSGRLAIVEQARPPGKHDHVDLVFSQKTVLRFTDPRRFGCVLWAPAGKPHPLLENLGPEPFDDEFCGDYLFACSRKRKAAIKNLLMDSKVVVGVGNIYASESLFRAGIRPGRAAGRITRTEAGRLVTETRQVLSEAIAQGGTTLKDFLGGDGKPGYFVQELNVYGREGQACYACGSKISQKRIGQRSSFYCPQCQK